MKLLTLSFALIISSATVAATPFSFSGAVLTSVFKSHNVGHEVFGAIRKTEYVSYNSLTNTHTVAISTERCDFEAYVQNVGDPMVWKFEVTTTSLIGCK